MATANPIGEDDLGRALERLYDRFGDGNPAVDDRNTLDQGVRALLDGGE